MFGNKYTTNYLIVNETRIIDRLIGIFRISHITTLRTNVTKALLLAFAELSNTTFTRTLIYNIQFVFCVKRILLQERLGSRCLQLCSTEVEFHL